MLVKVTVPNHLLGEFRKEIAKIEKHTGKRVVCFPVGGDDKRAIVHVQADLSRFEGWEVKAVYLRNKEKSIPVFLSEYRTDVNFRQCDHCHVNRERNVVFVIERDGEIKTVGSECLKKYFGGLDPVKIAEAIARLAEMNNKVWRGKGGKRKSTYVDAQWYYVAAYILRRKVYYGPTAFFHNVGDLYKVLYEYHDGGDFLYVPYYNRNYRYFYNRLAECIHITEEMIEEAKAAFTRAAEKEPFETFYKEKVMRLSDRTIQKLFFSHFCSIVRAEREREKLEERKRREQEREEKLRKYDREAEEMLGIRKEDTNHFKSKGENVRTVETLYVGKTSVNGYPITIFRTDENEILTLFKHSYRKVRFEKGKKYNLRFVPVENREFNGWKSTTIRVKAAAEAA